MATTALGAGGRRVACVGAGAGTTGPPPARPGVSGRRWCPIKQAAFPITAAGDEAAQLHLCGPARLCPLGDQCPGGFLHHTLAFSFYLWPHGTGACFLAPDWTLGSRREAMSWVLELPSPCGGLVPSVQVSITKPTGGLWRWQPSLGLGALGQLACPSLLLGFREPGIDRCWPLVN